MVASVKAYYDKSPQGRLRLLQLIGFILSFAALIWLSLDVVQWMTYVFRDPLEDMGHGWIVPLFSVALIWIRRKDLAAAAGKPSILGIFPVVAGLFLFWIGIRADQFRISQVSMFFLLWSISYVFYGKKFAGIMLFPVVFLLFTVPLGFIDIFTVKLRFLTSALASGLLNGIGIPVARSGTGIHCLAGEGFNLDVADPCSGLRSICALSALTAAYAYMSQKTLLKKWLLFACAVPIAVLGNLVRIFSIAVVAKFCGQEVATGFYHDYSGYLVFLVGILAVMQVASWLVRGDKKKNVKPEEPVRVEIKPCTLRMGQLLSVFVIPCLILATAVYIRRMPEPVEEPSGFIVPVLPALSDYRPMYPWFCQNEQCGKVIETESRSIKPEACPVCGSVMGHASAGELNQLPDDTGFRKCNYYDAMGDVYRVTVVINGKSRRSIHRPEVCLPAQGFSIENPKVEKFQLDSGNSLGVHCVDLRRHESSSSLRMGQGYFFVSAKYCVSSHLIRTLISIRDKAFFNKITKWAMVTVFCEESLTSTPERKVAVAKFLSQFYPSLLENKDQNTERTVK